MAKTPRITSTLSLEDQEILSIYINRMGLASSGQLLRMLISGNENQIQWIAEEFKKPLSMFDREMYTKNKRKG